MKWNYRMVKKGTLIGIHEVYYGSDGEIVGITHTPEGIVTYGADSTSSDEEVAKSLELVAQKMLMALKYPVVNFDSAVPPQSSDTEG